MGIDSFSVALTILFQKSIESSEIPEDWKKANITALYKKGVKSDPGNYRPISLTSVVSKILEKLIKKNLVLYLESNNLLKESQHGYRNNKSCLTNLLEYVEHVTSEIDLGKNVDVIYIDFCKAFDKVCHKKLVLKLKRYGIGGKVLSWITEWLTNRKQRVILNGEKSNWSNVKSGVPHGSV